MHVCRDSLGLFEFGSVRKPYLYILCCFCYGNPLLDQISDYTPYFCELKLIHDLKLLLFYALNDEQWKPKLVCALGYCHCLNLAIQEP